MKRDLTFIKACAGAVVLGSFSITGLASSAHAFSALQEAPGEGREALEEGQEAQSLADAIVAAVLSLELLGRSDMPSEVLRVIIEAIAVSGLDSATANQAIMMVQSHPVMQTPIAQAAMQSVSRQLVQQATGGVPAGQPNAPDQQDRLEGMPSRDIPRPLPPGARAPVMVPPPPPGGRGGSDY